MQTASQRLRLRLKLRYRHLRLRLVGLLGSSDSATAALHETWLQLDRVPDTTTPTDADAYLLRMASHIAFKHFRQDTPYLSAQALDELYELPDQYSDIEQQHETRQRHQQLLLAIGQLPPRRRAILLAARVYGESNQQIAIDFGVSVSTVEREIRLAVRGCQQQMEEVLTDASPQLGR